MKLAYLVSCSMIIAALLLVAEVAASSSTMDMSTTNTTTASAQTPPAGGQGHRGPFSTSAKWPCLDLWVTRICSCCNEDYSYCHFVRGDCP